MIWFVIGFTLTAFVFYHVGWSNGFDKGFERGISRFRKVSK